MNHNNNNKTVICISEYDWWVKDPERPVWEIEIPESWNSEKLLKDYGFLLEKGSHRGSFEELLQKIYEVEDLCEEEDIIKWKREYENICEDCRNEEDEMCENENCANFYKHRNENCDCDGWDCGFCQERFWQRK